MNKLSFMDKLLDGVEVEWLNLSQVAKIKHGKDWKGLNSGDIPVYGSGGIMGYVDEYAYDKPTVLIPRKGSITNIFYVESPFWNVDTIYYTEIDTAKMVPKYLYHFVKTIDLMALDTGSGRPSLTQAILNQLQIPIPCPDNLKKSLEIQSEIVRILDAFTAMTAELTAELNLRKQQYNYYRDQLLSFEEGEVEWRTLGSVCGFKNGFSFKSNLFRETGLPIVRITNVNGYNVNLTNVKYFDPSDYKENTKNYSVVRGDILIAMSGATTGKVGFYDSAETAYLNQRVGKFIPINELLDNRYLYHFLISNTEKIYILAGGGAQPNLSSRALMEKLLIPIPHANDPIKSIAEQKKIAYILDKLDTLTNSISEGLPREIELRQKQYEYYRDLLLSFSKPDASKSEAAA